MHPPWPVDGQLPPRSRCSRQSRSQRFPLVSKPCRCLFYQIRHTATWSRRRGRRDENNLRPINQRQLEVMWPSRRRHTVPGPPVRRDQAAQTRNNFRFGTSSVSRFQMLTYPARYLTQWRTLGPCWVPEKYLVCQWFIGMVGYRPSVSAILNFPTRHCNPPFLPTAKSLRPKGLRPVSGR
jgi:hypothetical protein